VIGVNSNGLLILRQAVKNSHLKTDSELKELADSRTGFKIVPALNGYAGAISLMTDAGLYVLHKNGGKNLAAEVPDGSARWKDDASFLISRWAEVRSNAIKRFNKTKKRQDNCLTKLADQGTKLLAKTGLVELAAPKKMKMKKPNSSKGPSAVQPQLRKKRSKRDMKSKSNAKQRKHSSKRIADKYVVGSGSDDDLISPVSTPPDAQDAWAGGSELTMVRKPVPVMAWDEGFDEYPDSDYSESEIERDDTWLGPPDVPARPLAQNSGAIHHSLPPPARSYE